MPQAQGSGRRGFNLAESLATLAIIAVAAAVVVPLVPRAARRAQRERCLANLREQGIAFRLHALDHDGRYPRSAPTSPMGPFPDGVGFAALSTYTDDRSIFYCPANRLIRPAAGAPDRRSHGSGMASYAYWARYPGGLHCPAAAGTAADVAGPNHAVLASDIVVTPRGAPGSPHPYTSHRGELIEGGAVLYNDGHVVWRDYRQMRRRLSGSGGLDWYF